MWESGEKGSRFTHAGYSYVVGLCRRQPFSTSSGDFIGQVEYLSKALANLPAIDTSVAISQRDAQSVDFSNNSVISTDPPYYDNVPYADMSDFFYVVAASRPWADVPGPFRYILYQNRKN